MKLNVDVITKTKNRPILLKRAIQSVANQSFENWTHIIINDGGDPAPVEAIVRELAPNFRSKTKLIHNQVSSGMEAASNLGIRNGTGALVVLLDDDDTWHPNFLSTCVETLAKAPQLKGVVTRTSRVEERIVGNKIVEFKKFEVLPPLKSVSLSELVSKNLFTTNAFVYRRTAWEVVGPYREDLPVLGDWEFNIRFLSHFDVEVVKLPLAFYHTRPADSGPASNSVIAQIDVFEKVRASLFNEYLRNDLACGTIGIGVLAAICQSASSASVNAKQRGFFERAVSYITRRLSHLSKNG